ncbi:MAG TPA: lipopolysaccharide biosynthesis protein [Pyrinomonadaceae bacterium]|nr:lipopolysaccharide biosynthesis protein [Pyrinomonadaceae bacterium]
MTDKTGKTRGEDHLRTDHLLDSIGARTARGGVVTIFSHGCKFAVGIIATAILARLLTPNDYGLIGMVAVVTNFVSMFKDLGLSLATVQKPEINYAQVSTLFWINIGLSVALCLMLVMISPAVGWFYGEPLVTKITAVTALGLILGGLSVQHEALLKRQMRFFALSLIAFVSMTVGYIVGIFFAWKGFGYWALVFSQMALLGANTVGVWLACRWVPSPPRRGSDIKSMLSFGGDITGYATVNYFSKNADTLLIGRFAGPQQLGFYTKSAQILSLPTDQLSEPINSVAIPTLSRLAPDPERYRAAYRRMVEKVLMFSMPGIALMIATSDWLVRIMLGPQWDGTSTILMLMGLAYLFQPLVNTGGLVLVTQGRSREMLHWSLISAPFSILAIVIGLPWGAVGVAASYSFTRLFVVNPLMFWFIGRSGPVPTADFYRLLAPYTGASVLVFLACMAFRSIVPVQNPLVGLVSCSVIGGVAALGTLLLMPAGRSALIDIKNSLHFLKPNRRPGELEHA